MQDTVDYNTKSQISVLKKYHLVPEGYRSQRKSDRMAPFTLTPYAKIDTRETGQHTFQNFFSP